jgi:hypothetical protein
MSDAVDVIALEEGLGQRIAVLRRYRRMLELQRDRLQEYLALIDTREQAVRAGDVDSLERYAQAEQGVVKGIMAVQRCIEPLAELYRQAAPEGSPDIDELHGRLEALRGRILERNAESVGLLKDQMDRLKAEIGSLRVPAARRSVYAGTPEPQLLNVVG